MKSVTLILAFCLLFTYVNSQQSQECTKFVESIFTNISNIQNVLPSIMYSGITTNNPGQFYECQTTPNFTYFLVTVKNTTTNINSFTGICAPSFCTKQDLKIALNFWNCEVYDFVNDSSNALAIIGLVVLCLWLALLIIWSIVLSCKQPETNQYVKKQKEENSVNSLVDRSSNQTDVDQQGKGDFMKSHIFNYYQGYSKIFKKQKRKSLIGSFLFLTVLTLLISVQFSFKQSISSNPAKSYDFFNSFWGIFVTNTQLSFSMIMFIFGMKLAYGVYKFVTFHEIGRFYFDQLIKKWLLFLVFSLSIYGVMTLYTDAPLSKFWTVNFAQDCPKYMWQEWFLFRHLQIDSKACMPWLWIMQADVFLTLLSAPFVIIFRVKKNIGYLLMGLVCLMSVVIAIAILSDQSIVFEPTKIFNMGVEYGVNYQTNLFVRAGPFFLGLIFAFLIIEGLQKVQGKHRTYEYKIAKTVRKSKLVHNGLIVLGTAIMITIMSLISIYFTRNDKNLNKTSSYYFIALTPTIFLFGFAMFILPSFWQVQTGLSYFITKIFAWSGWNSLQKICGCLLPIGPAVIGFTTFSTQNNIYFDAETIFVYLLGDLLMVYVISLLACAAIQNQIGFMFNFAQSKIFGKENKYSILLLEE